MHMADTTWMVGLRRDTIRGIPPLRKQLDFIPNKQDFRLSDKVHGCKGHLWKCGDLRVRNNLQSLRYGKHSWKYLTGRLVHFQDCGGFSWFILSGLSCVNPCWISCQPRPNSYWWCSPHRSQMHQQYPLALLQPHLECTWIVCSWVPIVPCTTVAFPVCIIKAEVQLESHLGGETTRGEKKNLQTFSSISACAMVLMTLVGGGENLSIPLWFPPLVCGHGWGHPTIIEVPRSWTLL